MYIRQIVLSTIFLPIMLYSSATKEANSTDCLGTIILHNGEKIDVNDIQIGMHSNFEVYSIPQLSPNAPEVDKQGHKEVMLTSDPRDAAITFNIINIKTIQVSDPNAVYIYKKNDKSMGNKYIEIMINGDTYLAPEETKIEAVQKAKDNRRTIKLRALKEFAIKKCIVIEPQEKKSTNSSGTR
ncbi:MAG TPA: hypothetical protein VGW78_03470 [Candidatus Babeliales bacterium]|nr:hypothetical protein [Candidatus Babeliales bacterium]